MRGKGQKIGPLAGRSTAILCYITRHAGILNARLYKSNPDIEGLYFAGERFTERFQCELGSAVGAERRMGNSA